MRDSVVRFTIAGAAAILSSALYAGGATVIKSDSSWGRISSTLLPTASGSTVRGSNGRTHNISGNIYSIPESQGKVAGRNLFHSFESFSVGTGDAAVFTTTTPTLQNVIGRVSGSSPTGINGLLALLPAPGSNPNLFFINPAGVMFGAGAQIDVPAAFYVSTANHLRFADGRRFVAGNGSDSTLSIAAPAAFGFLGTTRATVAVTGGAVLETSSGQSLSVVGSDIRIDDDAALATRGGADIRLIASGADAVEIPLRGSLPLVHGFLNILNGGRVRTSSSGAKDGGNIVVAAGDITIDGKNRATPTGISSTASPDDLNGGLISTSTSTSLGFAGSIQIAARYVVIDGQLSEITASAERGSSGQTGTVTINATNAVVLLNGGVVSIRNHAIVVDPTRLVPTLLSVSASDIVLDGGEIIAWSTGNLPSSDIKVKFTDRFALDRSAIFTTAGDEKTGNIHLEGGKIFILDRSMVNTSSLSFRSGNTGDITIQATVMLMKTGFIQANGLLAGGSDGNVVIHVQILVASGGTLIVGGNVGFAFDPDQFGLNVIQAASPLGVTITTPVLDIAGRLKGMSEKSMSFGTLGKDLCRLGAGSSFTPVGRGGLRPTASEMIRPAGMAVAAEQATFVAATTALTGQDTRIEDSYRHCQ
jgi:filamentous hemagglutinin family protein